MLTMKKLFTYKALTFDSDEERRFYIWCEEAFKAGFITGYFYHTRSFNLSEKVDRDIVVQLKSKTKTKKKHLLREHIYTPDFILEPDKKFHELNLDWEIAPDGKIYIDVKGGFSIYNNEREFKVNQKWVFQKYGVFINKVIPKKIFRSHSRQASKTNAQEQVLRVWPIVKP